MSDRLPEPARQEAPEDEAASLRQLADIKAEFERILLVNYRETARIRAETARIRAETARIRAETARLREIILKGEIVMPPQRPRRRLTDLCWMALFRMLKPKDQVKASRMSSRCAILVRAANRRVRTLIITNRDDFDCVKYGINLFSIASKPVMRQLPDVNEPLVGDYPMTTRVSKWNCLHTRDLPTTEELVYIFSAVTDLKFGSGVQYIEEVQYLVDLLLHPNWAGQLTYLTIDILFGNFVDEDSVPYDYNVLSPFEISRFFTALNSLSALEYLAITIGEDVDVLVLPILAQLKVIVISMCSFSGPESLRSFLSSLERHAADNACLKVHLLTYSENIETNLLSLSEPLCSRIVSIGEYSLNAEHFTSLHCSRFTSLTSLAFYVHKASHVGPLFTALSQLPQLVHLGLRFAYYRNDIFKELPWSSRPQTQLKSVRALDLELSITSHSQVQWLNLQWTLPHLQAIHLQDFRCHSCKVNIRSLEEDEDSASFPAARKCLQEALLSNLNTGVHPGRIIFQTSLYSSKFLSFDKL